MIRKMLKIAILALSLLTPGLSNAASPSLDFIIVQPGQPGSPQEAKPVMDALAGYLQRHLNDNVQLAGKYFNQTQPALAALETDRPRWGIVSLGFFVEYANQLNMHPIASTQPAGNFRERWYLMAAKGQAANWRQMDGSVKGTMLFQSQAASRLMFASPLEQLPFTLEGTSSPLRALREVAAGKSAGVILDQTQYQALKSLALFDKLTVVHRSEPLPTAPVVFFGRPDDPISQLTDVLQKMATDPTAADLLQMLQTAGFGPPDPDLARLVEDR